jgi:ubiquitin-protein ligase
MNQGGNPMTISIILNIPQQEVLNHQVTIPDDVPVREIIQRIVKQLPEKVRDTKEYKHDLFLERNGKVVKLVPEESLRSQDVREGDTLSLVVDKQVASWCEARLANEYKKILETFVFDPYILVKPLKGDPPVSYEVVYAMKGFTGPPAPGSSEMPPVGNEHVLRISLDPRKYPNAPPDLKMQTPVFHPNISSSGEVCVGQLPKGNWNIHLWIWKDVIVQTGRMINYDLWNLDSAFNSGAKDFVRERKLEQGIFPLDSIDFSVFR